jgi:putative redox protein
MDQKINEVTAVLGNEPYTTTIKMGKHTIISDEPVESGGAGMGPKAHDLLLSALVACTCITVRMYAIRKGWDLKSVEADARMERRTASGIQTTTVMQKLTFTGELNDEQKERLVFIACKCPVHKTLSPAMEIVTELAAL